MKLDPAIIKVLALDPNSTHVASHGGSGFTATAKITTTTNSHGSGTTEKFYFLKTSHEKDAHTMFEGEHASLNAIHAVVPSLCPVSLAHGSLSDSKKGAFLVTEFLDLSATSRSSRPSSTAQGSGLSLASKLAKLHTTPAPPPPNSSDPRPPLFGFPVPTACGSTIQSNKFTPSWATFYAEQRLLPILALGEQRHGPDAKLRSLVTRTASVVVPRLLGDDHLKSSDGGPIVPVVVHGDLWSGNHGVARVGGPDGPVEEVVFDPSACYAHSEYELGIMRMFGGFDERGFFKEYFQKCPKSQPVDEFEDRMALYETYHYLNHWAIFAGSYRNSAAGRLERLLKKYGGDTRD